MFVCAVCRENKVQSRSKTASFQNDANDADDDGDGTESVAGELHRRLNESMCSATVTTGGGSKKPSITVFGQAVHLAELKQSRNIEFTRKSMHRLHLVTATNCIYFPNEQIIVATNNNQRSIEHIHRADLQPRRPVHHHLAVFRALHVACACARALPGGIVQEVVFNEDFNLTKDFTTSFVRDIMKVCAGVGASSRREHAAQGLQFLHETCQIPHGALNARSCLVTQYWSLKLGNFGLNDILDDLAARDMIAIEHDENDLESKCANTHPNA